MKDGTYLAKPIVGGNPVKIRIKGEKAWVNGKKKDKDLALGQHVIQQTLPEEGQRWDLVWMVAGVSRETLLENKDYGLCKSRKKEVQSYPEYVVARS